MEPTLLLMIDTRTDVPSAPPTCKDVACNPPATPPSRTGALPTIASDDADITMPTPSPSATNGGHIVAYDESALHVSIVNAAPPWRTIPSGIVTRAPNRSVSFAPSGDASIDARLSGSVRTPDSTGVNPRTFWRYSITKKITPSRMKKLSAVTNAPTVSAGLRNSRIGSRGWATRVSYQPKRTSTAIPPPIAPSVPPEVQPHVSPLTTPNTTASSPPASRTTPGTSNFSPAAASLRDCGSTARPKTRAMTPMGALM
ncbi:hypothetical protein a10_06852 [Streptomyces acidiscabies]|nr:hypothetical protein a10_06852 [Streptomyces acidiscabies]